MDYILSLDHVALSDINQVGGKNASLGEMITHLTALGIKVPGGFATTADAYQQFLRDNQLDKSIYQNLAQLDVDNIEQLNQISAKIRESICAASFSDEFIQHISKAYEQLQLTDEQSVAVRSSATAEDLPEASFAGQQETYLNVAGIENVLEAIKKVYASLFTDRAITYRVHHNFAHDKVSISAGVQRMVRSDLASSGIAFSIDTESGFDQVIFITSAYGLGETIVQGDVNPDEFCVFKPTLEQGKRAIVSRKLGSKLVKMIYSNDDANVATVNVPEQQQRQYSLNDDELIVLAEATLAIEKHYGKPMDVEWAKDGIDGDIYIVQARPETVQSQQDYRCIKQYQLTAKSDVLATGRSVGQKIGKGTARFIENPKQMDRMQQGDVLIAERTEPDWEPIMKRAAAIVTRRGGRTCHAAIVARELGIPAIVGCGDELQAISDGEDITVCCAEGETGVVYQGLLDYEVETQHIDNLAELPVKICMNLANPEQAFAAQFLPNEGVGLARLEFIIGNMIGIHPNALLRLDEMPADVKQQIEHATAAYASPTEFYIERLVEGIGKIAAAFYPKPIIVRFSDFKSNEYGNLLGGRQFEPKEENPMLGYRGASRYLLDDFRDCFFMECEAIKRVRERVGLTNTHVMFPFVRTLREAEQLNPLINSAGLKRGENGLKVYMMCEIPSNAILAEEFLQHFDGYSIGSNDLTQLTLGLDRDSELVAGIFDERNPSVKELLHRIIHTCKRLDKYVGICGQGPSDHPDFAKWLVEEGIDSLSLSPDSIMKTWMMLAGK